VRSIVNRLNKVWLDGATTSERDVEIALREALANAIIHENHEGRRKHVHVTCRCEPDEVSIAVKDEGSGFDLNTVTDPRKSAAEAHKVASQGST
jgi:anti-sigma regulatory factor (Ser/Thr protein kinase)